MRTAPNRGTSPISPREAHALPTAPHQPPQASPIAPNQMSTHEHRMSMHEHPLPPGDARASRKAVTQGHHARPSRKAVTQGRAHHIFASPRHRAQETLHVCAGISPESESHVRQILRRKGGGCTRPDPSCEGTTLPRGLRDRESGRISRKPLFIHFAQTISV